MLDTYKERWQVQSDRAIKPGLDSIKRALEALGHPERGLAVVHLAGTNGKGSTLTFIEQIALQHGLTVAKFMSPCIIDVHDQLQVNGEPISPTQMDHIFQRMHEVELSGQLTDFELLTCAAFLHFIQQNVDLVLVEAGMGGREDSTNVITPIVSVIPSISLEHTNFLGTTIESIASHKAGIIKNGKPVVLGRLLQEAMSVMVSEASIKNAPVFKLGTQFDTGIATKGDYYINDELDVRIDGLQRQLPGDHQRDNMALGITAFFEVANALNVSVDVNAIKRGVATTKVPSRFDEVLPNVFFDGAHNPASAKMLAQTIKQQFSNKRIEFIIGMLADKDIEAVLRTLEGVGDKFIFVDFPNERAIDARQMLKISKASEKEIVQDCIPLLQKPVNEQTIRIVTGSLYLLSEIRKQLIIQ